MMIDHDVPTLERVEVLAGMPAEALALLRPGSRVQRYPAGAVLVHQGEPAACLLLIRSGCPQMKKAHRHIKAPIILGDLGVGETVGSPGLLDGAPSPFSVLALEETEVLELDAALIARVLRRYPSAAGPLLRALGSSFRTAIELTVPYR